MRAMIVDSAGRLVTGSAGSHPISFWVVSGPGAILGVGNGNPSSHEPNAATSRHAYHGLARAVVKVTSDDVADGTDDNDGSPWRQRARLRAWIDTDASPAARPAQTGSAGVPRRRGAVPDIVVAASAPGLGEGRITIPISTDVRHSVVAVARRSVVVDVQLT